MSVPANELMTSRQTAHALGITVPQLSYMRNQGEATPTYKIPGSRGGYLWSRTEIQRLLDLSDRRTFRRRRARTKYPLDGLVPVMPRPRRRSLPAPPA